MKQYLDFLKDIRLNGTGKRDRTGTGTLSSFGRQLHFDLEKGFRLLTTKKVHFPSVFYEWKWFCSDSTNQADTFNNVWLRVI